MIFLSEFEEVIVVGIFEKDFDSRSPFSPVESVQNHIIILRSTVLATGKINEADLPLRIPQSTVLSDGLSDTLFIVIAK